MGTEAETVERFYAALNRNDVDAVVELLDPEIVRVEFEGTPAAGTFRGLADVRAHVARGRGTWAEGSCEVERLRVSGEKVLVDVHVRVRLRDAAEWLDGRLVDGFELRGGKIVRFVSFAEAAEAVRWAGMEG